MVQSARRETGMDLGDWAGKLWKLARLGDVARIRRVCASKAQLLFLPNAFLAAALRTVMVTLSAPSYSQPETCPCPLLIRDSQNDAQSLADAAKEAKKNKGAHAKRPFPTTSSPGKVRYLD